MNSSRASLRQLELFFLLAVAAFPAPSLAQAKFNIGEARKSVVYIKRITPGVAPASGSGFLMSGDGLIYTNRHVVVAADDNLRGTVLLVGVPTARDSDVLAYYRAELVHAAPAKLDLDFAVLKIASAPGAAEFKPLRLADEKAQLGSDVAVLGFPKVIEDQPNLSFTKGSLSASKVLIGDRPYYQTDAVVNPGNSGGPLLNEKGEVLGIITFKKRDALNLGFALHNSEIAALADAARKQAAEIKPPPGPLAAKDLPTAATVVGVKKDHWEVGGGTQVREFKEGLVLDANGGQYWIASKDKLPEDFQLVIRGQIDFLQGGQVLQPSQRSILRSLAIRFGTPDTTTPILERKGYMIRFSHQLLLLYKEGAPDAVAVAQTGNSREPFTFVVTKKGGEFSIAVDGKVVLKYHDKNPLPATNQICIGGYLSRLYLSEVSVLKLDKEEK